MTGHVAENENKSKLNETPVYNLWAKLKKVFLQLHSDNVPLRSQVTTSSQFHW